MFAEATLWIPGESANRIASAESLALQFGDVFFATKEDNPERAYLVISQSCDLAHAKLAGSVLCLEGAVAPLADSPVDDLKNQSQLQYVGRLNDMYALEAQRSFLDDIGRIGVPVRPAHLVSFSKCRVKALDEKRGLSFEEEMRDDICCVLRSEKAKSGVKAYLNATSTLTSWLHTFLKLRLLDLGTDEEFKLRLSRLLEATADPTSQLTFRSAGEMSFKTLVFQKDDGTGPKVETSYVLLDQLYLDITLTGKSASPGQYGKKRIELHLEQPSR
jgi:hypothetical protein